MSPSARFSLTSPLPPFSPLAVTWTTLSVTLPGMPVASGPVTPDALSPSTVFVHVGWGSAVSKEDEKSCDAAGAAELPAAVSMAMTITITITGPTFAESRLRVGLNPLQIRLNGLCIVAYPQRAIDWPDGLF